MSKKSILRKYYGHFTLWFEYFQKLILNIINKIYIQFF